jgi:hydroxymethylbilane synthase
MTASFLRIGTRGSRLALWQAHAVRSALASVHDVAEDEIEIVTIRTTGDQVKDRALAEIGGKGLFTKELEEALIDNRVDLAVHSAKDVPTFLPPGLCLAACLPRADVRDVLIAPRHRTLEALPEGAIIGTASVRRAAILKHMRPDLKTVLLRGNVETRLRKVEVGEMQATLLALAGLARLGLEQHATEIFETETMLPACGQGAVAIEIRSDDAKTRDLVEAIDDHDTSIALTAERAMLAVLDGSCRTPIAGHAVHYTTGSLHLRGLVIAPDGSAVWNIKAEGAASDAEQIGRAAGEDLLGRVPAGLLTDGPR